MGSKAIYIADLTHTANGISAQTFPLGASYVLAYAQHKLGNEFQFKLFRFPEYLTQAIIQNPPEVIAFSNYSWNFELSYKIAHWAKKMNPGVVTIFGGPNFPVSSKEQYQFLEPRPDLDIYIRNEGEIGFTDVIFEHQFDYDLTEQLDSNTLANLLLTEQGGDSIVLRFSHTDKQKLHIQNAARLSEHSATGLGKMLQFNNLRAMFLNVERVETY